MEQTEIQAQINELRVKELVEGEDTDVTTEENAIKETREKANRNLFFVQVAICSIIIVGALYLKYIAPNHIFKENIKEELMQTVALEDVKQFVYELAEMSDKYWRIK